jgi:hypothetical protein
MFEKEQDEQTRCPVSNGYSLSEVADVPASILSSLPSGQAKAKTRE